MRQYLALLSLALMFAALPAESQGMRVVIDENSVSIISPLLGVNIRLNQGGGITTWKAVEEGRERDMTELAYPLPTLAIYAYTKNVTGRYTFVLGDRSHTVSLPTLTYQRWRAELIANASELISVVLTPSPEAASDIEPLQVSVTVRARLWSPALEYTITFVNPSAEAVTLKGPFRGPQIYLIVYTSDPSKWVGTIVDTGTDKFRGQRLNGTEGVRVLVNADSIAMASYADPKNTASLNQLVGIQPLEPRTLFVNFSRGLRLGNVTVRNAVALTFATQEVTLLPQQSFTISFRVAYLPYNPVMFSMAGLDSSAIIAHQGYLNNLTTLAFRDPIASFVELRSQVNNLSKEVEKLSARTKELEGLKSYWENEIKIRDNDLKSLKGTLEERNLVTIGLLALGFVLGLAGGFVAARAREGVAREVPRRRKG
ncbi:MAG: hypothetical protein ABDH61_04590 [Acidilobaceae archaeon]